MRFTDPRLFASVAAAVALTVSCGGGSPTRPSTSGASCANPVFGDPAGSLYCLPYSAGTAYTVSQSYCSSGSHAGRFAFDFDLPMGTEVLAARAGEVRELREHFSDDDTQGGHENMVALLHSDGTTSLYIHMRQQGVLVESGDYVPQGGLLGWSGSSGTGFPHIHFQVCISGQCNTATNEITLPVSFRNAEGPLDAVGGLVTGESYRALACG